MSEATKKTAERLATEAGMQFDLRYNHWVSVRGKFEGEQWYAPYFWDAGMNGDGEELYPANMEEGDELQTFAAIFDPTIDECETFGIAPRAWVLVRQDSQGFVMVTIHESAAAARAKYSRWIGE